MPVHIQPDFSECKPFGYYAKIAIVELIQQQTNPHERAEWTRIACEAGVISQADAEFLR